MDLASMLSFIKSDLSMLNPFFATGSSAREGKTEADGFGNRRVPFLPPLPTSVLPPTHSWKKRFFLPELEFSKVFVKFLWQNFRFSLIPKFHFLPFFFRHIKFVNKFQTFHYFLEFFLDFGLKERREVFFQLFPKPIASCPAPPRHFDYFHRNSLMMKLCIFS